MIRKLGSKRGESLVEILVSVLIVALGCMMIATMYSAAMNMNLEASEEDDTYYGALSEMEQLLEKDAEKTGSGEVTITDQDNKSYDIKIDTFGNDKNIAYNRH